MRERVGDVAPEHKSLEMESVLFVPKRQISFSPRKQLRKLRRIDGSLISDHAALIQPTTVESDGGRTFSPAV